MRVRLGDLAPQPLVYFGLHGLSAAFIGPQLPAGCDPVAGCLDPLDVEFSPPNSGEHTNSIQPFIGPALPAGCDPVSGCPDEEGAVGAGDVVCPAGYRWDVPTQECVESRMSNNVLMIGAVAAGVFLLLGMRR